MKTETTEIKTTSVEEAANALFGLESAQEFLPAVLMGAAKWVSHEGGDTFWDCLRHMIESTDFKLIEPAELGDAGVGLVEDKLRLFVYDFDENEVIGDIPVSKFLEGIESFIDQRIEEGITVKTELKQLNDLIEGLSKIRQSVEASYKGK